MKALFITRKGNIQITEEREIDQPHQVYLVPFVPPLSVDDTDYGIAPMVTAREITYIRTNTTKDGMPVYLHEN